MNCRANGVEKSGDLITAVRAKNVETSKEYRFEGTLFADCTGDASIGALAGADFMTGRESKSEFGEATAQDVKDKITMGSSVQWNSVDLSTPDLFPDINWGLAMNEKSVHVLKVGDWDWENCTRYPPAILSKFRLTRSGRKRSAAHWPAISGPIPE